MKLLFWRFLNISLQAFVFLVSSSNKSNRLKAACASALTVDFATLWTFDYKILSSAKQLPELRAPLGGSPTIFSHPLEEAR